MHYQSITQKSSVAGSAGVSPAIAPQAYVSVPAGPVAGETPALPGIAIFSLCAVLLAAFAVWGSPFLLDYLNSGDQLPPMLQAVDPQLFPNDPVVAAMGRLKSGFYLGLAAAMRFLKLAPQQTEGLIHSLYIASKLLLIVAAFAVTRALRKSFWFFVVFAAWCCHQKPALLGSVTLFMPIITHNEVALILGMFAIACLLCGRMFLFWALAGVSVLVHVLVGLQFLLCFGPVLLWRREFNKGFFAGMVIFVACCLLYLLTMTPPVLSPADWQLFVAANGHTAHISLFNHGWLDWFGFVSFFGLALISNNRFLKGDTGFELLRRAAVCGAVIGLLLSFAAVVSQAMKLMLFQPMRVFFWVTLLCFLMLAAAAVEAFKQTKTSRLAAALLAIVLALTVLNSILAPLFAFLGLSYFIAEWLAIKFNARASSMINLAAQTALTIGIGAIFAAWALGDRQPVDSLRSPVLLLPGLLCLAILFLPRMKRWQAPLAGVLIGYCLIAASHYRYDYAKRWTDPDWRAVRLWCQTHTQPSDRFITPPDQIGFRVLALRSTASESLPRVIWAAPQTYLANRQAVESAAKGYVGGRSDPTYLFGLARAWQCDYVVARGSYDAKFTPLFRSGEFSVLKVPQQD